MSYLKNQLIEALEMKKPIKSKYEFHLLHYVNGLWVIITSSNSINEITDYHQMYTDDNMYDDYKTVSSAFYEVYLEDKTLLDNPKNPRPVLTDCPF